MRKPLIGIVLAAGHGTRMRSRVPKVLFPLLGRPLLDYPLQLLEDVGCSRVIVVIGAGGDRVRAAFADRELEWALQDPPRGTGDAVLVGLRAAGCDGQDGDASPTVLILNGDLPLVTGDSVRRLLETHERRQATLTLLTAEKDDPRGFGRVRLDPQGEIQEITEEADLDDATRAIREVNVGVYAADAGALYRGLQRLAEESPANAQNELYLPPVISPLRKSGGRVVAERLPAESAEIRQVNDRSELADVSAIRRRQIIREHQIAGVTIVDPETTYIEEDVEIGRDTTIYPFCYLQRGVRIGTECHIGPFTHLRVGTELDPEVHIGNFTEVKDTRMGRGSKAKHLSYLGDGEVGERVNIGAGTIFANYDGIQKNLTEIGDRAFVGSGTIFIAPVRMGADARTGAGSVVVRGRTIPDGATVVGVPAKLLPEPTHPPRNRSGPGAD